MSTGRPILIAGPTASGKSGLALALAERCDGLIINADSMQVYRELRIITARPSLEDEARVPHALYGHVSAREAYSAGRWVEDVRSALARAEAERRRAIIVGGTGFYFKALLEGLSPIPAVPSAVRAHWREEARRIGPARLHALLAERDPELAARLAPNDRQRVTRGLEVLEATGRPLSNWQREPRQPVLRDEETVRVLMSIGRDELYARTDARFEAMMRCGAVEEVAALAALGLDPEAPAMGALGVRPLLAMLQGAAAAKAGALQAKLETRQYAKRQLTWLRRNMSAWAAVDAQLLERNSAGLLTFIDN